jgi:hypothetical protein
VSEFTRALTRYPIYPLLLAAYAVLYIYAQNLTEVLPVDLVAPLGRALIGAATVFAFTALIYRDWRRGALVAAAIVVGASVFGLVDTRLERLTGLDETQLLLAWVALIAAVAVVAALLKGSLATVTMLCNAFALVLVSLSLLTIVPYESARAARPSQSSADNDAPIATATRLPNRDIYFLIFDRYGSNWSIEHRFGITDNDLPDWLASHGFQVVPGARASYRTTDMSLASTLNMQMLDDLTATMGRTSSDRTPIRRKLQRTEVAKFLKANGYRYYHLGAWFEPTRTNPLADEVLTYGEDTELTQVLHKASALPAIENALSAGVQEDPFRVKARNMTRFQFRQLERLASVPGRKFVFAHLLIPHPPYVLAADGRRMLEHEARTRPEAELYREQLGFVSAHVKQLVDALLAGPDESDPIIVIMGDEGPFMCRNTDCVEKPALPETLGIRLGLLAAFYLPGLPDGAFPPNMTAVNTFRTIFREYFGADLPPLPDRTFNHPDNQHLYDYQDVTDILPLPGGPAMFPSTGASAAPDSGGAPSPSSTVGP